MVRGEGDVVEMVEREKENEKQTPTIGRGSTKLTEVMLTLLKGVNKITLISITL